MKKMIVLMFVSMLAITSVPAVAQMSEDSYNGTCGGSCSRWYTTEPSFVPTQVRQEAAKPVQDPKLATQGSGLLRTIPTLSGSAESGNTLEDCGGSCGLWYLNPDYKARFVFTGSTVIPANPKAPK